MAATIERHLVTQIFDREFLTGVTILAVVAGRLHTPKTPANIGLGFWNTIFHKRQAFDRVGFAGRAHAAPPVSRRRAGLISSTMSSRVISDHSSFAITSSMVSHGAWATRV